MEYKNIFEELVDRGYFEQATYEDELKELLSKERVKFYIGFDATADSLTIGHFIQIMVMKRMQNYGHIPIALLGGGTTILISLLPEGSPIIVVPPPKSAIGI